MVGDQAMTVVAIGVGCRKGCPADVIEALVRQALGDAVSSTPLGLFTLVDKQSEVGLNEAANRLGLDVIYLSREALRDRADDTKTPSPSAEKQFGVPSVAEAAALAGAGPASVLIVPRIAQDGATCAIARPAS
jgi:cobalamin biosynthesis protein CbiG